MQKPLTKQEVCFPLLSMLQISVGSRGKKSLLKHTIFTLIQHRTIIKYKKGTGDELMQ
jgi:hypothetical protein